MYEHCFRNLRAETRAKLKESRTSLVGFSGEVSYPIGTINLNVTMGEPERLRIIPMEFAVVKSHSPYNVILGRTGLRSLGAVASTIHSMIKFPTANGIATGEPEDTVQPPPSPPEKDTQIDEKIEGKDKHPERSLKSKPLEKVVIHDDYPDQTITIRGNLFVKCRSELIEILWKHANAFFWTLADMTRIPCFIAENELKTYPHIEPRVQRKRSIALNRRKIVKDEVAEWLKARIVRKDLYPLPEIDWKIESLMGFKYKCFLDVYKGLKNVRATYQRLVDSIFEEQMGRNLEAYVDDMVIKSKTEPEMIKDVEETLLTLKKVNMKLNPKKCSFKMEEGKFLGYIVTSEGIRANPEKAKVVVNMPSPSNLKQIKRLSGKLAALNRFLSKAAEKALPCLDTLKKCTNKKDFHWTAKAEEAFQEIKRLITELPTLTAPKKEEELMVYLSAANEAVSVVLLVERQRRQASIHYVSRTLQGAEIN
ncbi:reverse transcriptase domain-containing protein [Tanacetum coccineum]|uniref:Reverse transcriptase domain-containing protein n=1 Tax=Tanacetum coccineum TaxID=301880 RepID=A0ABQ5B6D7_9ASTR